MDTKVPKKTRTRFFFPKIEKEESPKKDKALTRKQKADNKKLENMNVPKKNTIEHRKRIVDIEIIELSDDETKKSVPEHHGAQTTVTKNVKQDTHKRRASQSSKPQTSTQKPTVKCPANPPQRIKRPVDTESPQKVNLPVVRAKDKKIINLCPRSEENAKAYDITRSNLKRLITHRNSQTASRHRAPPKGRSIRS